MDEVKEPKISSMKLSEHLSEVMSLIEEGSSGIALDYLNWIIRRLAIHDINPELGAYETPSELGEE